jgi:antitoxin (DNA-binding transcriptional repressor) of toxin-antitoxin stability system
MPASVTSAYARAHFSELLKAVEDGQTVVITRHDKAIAELSPSRSSLKAGPRFGTLKGKVKLLDPHALDAMSAEEADAFISGRKS